MEAQALAPSLSSIPRSIENGLEEGKGCSGAEVWCVSRGWAGPDGEEAGELECKEEETVVAEL